MLSKLLRFKVVAETGESGRLTDVAVALLDRDYPPVTQIFCEINRKIHKFAWESVQSIDWKNREIKIASPKAAAETSWREAEGDVMLREEILDALLLELRNRRAIRANDLQLEEENGQLLLKCADPSLSAMVRRISFGFYNHIDKSGLHDWKYVEFLRGDPQAVNNGEGYNLRITRMSPGDIAQLTNFIPYLHAAELLTLLPDAKAVKTLELMPAARQLQVFEELEEKQALRLLALMAPDAAADLCGRLTTPKLKSYLEKLPARRRQLIIELLRYPEDTVGGIMTNDVAFLCLDLTVGEARQQLRKHFQNSDFVYLICVVSDEETKVLRGMISLRDLITADDEQKLADIMDPYIMTLDPLSAAKEAAYRVAGSQVAAVPVVNHHHKLLGAVTIDAAIMEITPTDTSETRRIFS